MRIAIPLLNGQLCLHFGHCEQFALIDVEEGSKKITNKQLLAPPAHEPGALPQWLAQLGTNIVIAGGMGSRAQNHFRMSGIKVIIGASGGSPENIVYAYLNGTLVTGANVCDH